MSYTHCMTNPATRFDAEYYRHWYGNAQTRAFTKSDKDVRAAFVLSYLRMLKVPVRSVCDLGCGLGHWREALQKIDSRIGYTGVEVSPFVARRFGWVESSVVDYVPKRQFDLLICQAVLQHLDDKACAQALAQMGAYCRGALYLEVLTKGDWTSGVVDKKHTEKHEYLRSATWYKRHLSKHFVAVGGGLFVARSAGVPLLELEAF